MTRALVTGAGGFIGRRLVHALTQRGCQVVGHYHRKPVACDGLADAGSQVVGDVRDAPAVRHALQDVDWVFHLAAATAPRTMAESRAITVGGTHVLAHTAAERPHPPVLVYVSSLAAAGPCETPVTECSPCRPVSYYGRAKLEAEQLLGTLAARLPVTIVRPPCVFGPGDRNLLRLGRLVRRGWELHAHAQYRYSFLHVDDLVDGLIAAAAQGQRLNPASAPESAGVYFLADPQPMTFPELASLMAPCLGITHVRRLGIPRAAAWLAAAMGEVVQVTTRRKVYLNRDKVREAYAGSWVCDAARARAQLEFRPAFPLAERIAQTCQAFVASGWL